MFPHNRNNHEFQAENYERKGPKIVDLLDMKENCGRFKTSVPINETLFQPSVQEIIFRDYQPFTSTVATLSLRNTDTVRSFFYKFKNEERA